VPILEGDGKPFQELRAAGFTSVSVAFEIGSAWNDRTRTLSLSPATLELDRLFSTSLTVSIGNVPPGLPLGDPDQMAHAADMLEAGPLELSFHDGGGLDLVLAQTAKDQAISPSAARSKMIDEMNRRARMQPQQSAEFERLVDALGRFLSASGATLKVTLTPKGHVNLTQTLELAKVDPIAALSRFEVEVSVSGP
jgi:hypothetical protein